MGIAEEMKNLTSDIITSYEARLETIEGAILNTHQHLEKLRDERERISKQLCQTLADFESLRKKDFDNMMSEILSWQNERERQVRVMLKNFLEEHKGMACELKRVLSQVGSTGIEGFRTKLEEIKVWQEKREREVSTVLKDFQKEQQYLIKCLRELLAKGGKLRLRDFKAMLKNIQANQENRREELQELINQV